MLSKKLDVDKVTPIIDVIHYSKFIYKKETVLFHKNATREPPCCKLQITNWYDLKKKSL